MLLGHPGDEAGGGGLADDYAQLAANVFLDGREPRILDTWIAATALVNDAEVWTQDGDFSDFAQAVDVVRVKRCKRTALIVSTRTRVESLHLKLRFLGSSPRLAIAR